MFKLSYFKNVRLGVVFITHFIWSYFNLIKMFSSLSALFTIDLLSSLLVYVACIVMSVGVRLRVVQPSLIFDVLTVLLFVPIVRYVHINRVIANVKSYWFMGVVSVGSSLILNVMCDYSAFYPYIVQLFVYFLYFIASVSFTRYFNSFNNLIVSSVAGYALILVFSFIDGFCVGYVQTMTNLTVKLAELSGISVHNV